MSGVLVHFLFLFINKIHTPQVLKGAEMFLSPNTAGTRRIVAKRKTMEDCMVDAERNKTDNEPKRLLVPFVREDYTLVRQSPLSPHGKCQQLFFPHLADANFFILPFVVRRLRMEIENFLLTFYTHA